MNKFFRVIITYSLMLSFYFIIPFGDITEQMVSDCCQTSLETIRVSTNGNGILEYDSNKAKPESLADYEPVNIMEELKKAEWQIEE